MPYEKVKGNLPPMWSGKLNEYVEGTIVEMGKGKFGIGVVIELIMPETITLHDFDAKCDFLDATKLEKGVKVKMPANKFLETLLKDLMVGERIRVTAVDEVPTDKGNPMKRFNVEKWKNP